MFAQDSSLLTQRPNASQDFNGDVVPMEIDQVTKGPGKGKFKGGPKGPKGGKGKGKDKGKLGSAMCVVSLAILRPTAGRIPPTRGFKQFKSSNSNHQRGMSRNMRLLRAPLPPGAPKLCVLRLVTQRSFCTTLT